MKTISSALLVTGLVAASFLAASPAVAHDGLIDSTPAAGETLTTLPDAFSITMSEEMLDLDDEGSGFGLLVKDSAGLYYGDGCISLDRATMSAEAVLGEPGEYTLIWQVVSSDGHPTSDEFSFEWAPEGDFSAATGSEHAGDCNGQYAGDRQGNLEDDVHSTVDYSLWYWVGGGALLVLIAATIIVIARRKR